MTEHNTSNKGSQRTLGELNNSQKQLVKSGVPLTNINAGPGSRKTRNSIIINFSK